MTLAKTRIDCLPGSRGTGHRVTLLPGRIRAGRARRQRNQDATMKWRNDRPGAGSRRKKKRLDKRGWIRKIQPPGDTRERFVPLLTATAALTAAGRSPTSAGR